MEQMIVANQRKALCRQMVLDSYNVAKNKNSLAFMDGNPNASSSYIYPNQMFDAHNIINIMYEGNHRLMSVKKLTKIGNNGLMVEISKLFCTHPDDNFVVDPKNVFFLTGLNSVSWVKDLKDKVPDCFTNNIYHRGQLPKVDLHNIKDALIFVDEADFANKEDQILHITLRNAGILDIHYMTHNNIRIIVVSATLLKEEYDLGPWGIHHGTYKMTIPSNYIGCMDFLARGIIKEWFPLTTVTAVAKWFREDILSYGSDFRVNLARVNRRSKALIRAECARHDIEFLQHDSLDRLSEETIQRIFYKRIARHIVVVVVDFWRRADYFPLQWKLRIGATHERYTKKVDANVQAQGFPGRLTGPWRDVLDSTHRTGPYRTSVKAIQEYGETYHDPFGRNSYECAGFKKVNGVVKYSEPTMLSVKNIVGLGGSPVTNANAPPAAGGGGANPPPLTVLKFRIYSDVNAAKSACRMLNRGSVKYIFRATPARFITPEGFKKTAVGAAAQVMSLTTVINQIESEYASNFYREKGNTYRTYYPCYVSTTDITTEKHVIVIHPASESQLPQLDARFPPIPYEA